MRSPDSKNWNNLCRAVGTTHWMAPEVGSGTAYDEKADVFSFAMVMYEVICRRIPFEDKDAKAVMDLYNRGIRPDITSHFFPTDAPRKLVT